MEVVLAEYLGFCYGVKRAIGLARSAVPIGNACTLGPIIHNPQMVEKLANEGVGMVESLDEMPDGGTIIIRSHGVGPAVYDKIEKKHLHVIDATCPHVKKAQMAAHALAEDGCHVVIIGEKKHPEVKSILEWSGEDSVVVENEAEAGSMSPCGKMGIVAQTTFSSDKFQRIVSLLLSKSNDIHIVRTICTATDQRQKAAMELASNVDMMLVIGGKNSANTTRLAELCSKKTTTYHLETADELKDEWFNSIKKIGITAGASTPDWIIREVYQKCKTK